MQLPPIDEMLTSFVRLWKMRESLAFPVRDMLVTICSRNDGQYRPKVLRFLIDRVSEIQAKINGRIYFLRMLFVHC
jgi:E3 ubiquitin-protein ligase HUWE1